MAGDGERERGRARDAPRDDVPHVAAFDRLGHGIAAQHGLPVFSVSVDVPRLRVMLLLRTRIHGLSAVLEVAAGEANLRMRETRAPGSARASRSRIAARGAAGRSRRAPL